MARPHSENWTGAANDLRGPTELLNVGFIALNSIDQGDVLLTLSTRNYKARPD